MKIALFILIQLFPVSLLFSQKPSFPAWVFDSKYYNNVQFAVGISDPDLDSTAAFEQATHRALINYGIFHDCQYSSLTSVAIGNQQENSFNATGIETILYTGIIKGNFDFTDSIQFEKKEFSKYNECCVLIKKVPFKSKQTGICTFSVVRRTGFQKENNIFPVFIDEIEVKVEVNNSIKMTYLINREKDTFQIKSRFGSGNILKEIPFKNIYRNYFLSPGSDHGIGGSYYTSFSSGLWAAFLFELSDQISFNSILNKNKANQLITLEQGNINKNNEIGSLNNFVLSSKKLDTEPLKLSIENINIKANYLKIKLKQTAELANAGYQKISWNKPARKKLKKLEKEKWTALGYSDVKHAYSVLKTYEIRDEFIGSSITLETQNLGNGILKGMQIARTEIENQLKSKIKTLNQVELEDNSDLSVQTSKTLIGEKTERIEPYFIFFRKINRNYYQLELILFYKI